MARRWYFLTLVPVVLLLVIARVHAVSQQPILTMAGNASEFDRIVAVSGGVSSVQRGFSLDFVFVAVFLAIVPAVLRAGRGWWPVPVAAGTLDIAENALSLALVQATAPDFWFPALQVVAAVKLAAYALTVLEVVRRARKGRPPSMTPRQAPY